MTAPAPDLDDAQADTGPISNLEACARVVAKLIVDRYINPRHIHAAAIATGIPIQLIERNLERVAHTYTRPSSTIPQPIVVDPAGEPVRAKDEAAARANPRRSPTAPAPRSAARCHLEKHISQYRYVSKGRRPGGRLSFAWQSWCKVCLASYQQERYLSAAREAALASIGLELDGDALLCVVCAKPIDNDSDTTTIELRCHTACLATPG